MSSPLSVKRRRLNNATSTLSKPFVSPLKAAKTVGTPQPGPQSAGSRPYAPSTLAHTIKSANLPLQNPESEPNDRDTVLKHAATSKPIGARAQRPFKAFGRRTDPAELVAQKALTSLELQIRTCKNEVDTLAQAIQITTSNNDSELEDLAWKWRVAAQQVAEELFGTVKERVCRMGGVAAWRESEKRKYDRSNGLGGFAQEPGQDDDADCEFDSQGEELPEEEQEHRKKEKRRARQEAMDAADDSDMGLLTSERKTEVWQEAGNDDDEFTMDMMLRSLNIDLDVVGYDKREQRWIS
ncbi:Hypothetical protein R9X50_00605700 [Acrodontium crateriforme]|uniref:Uncharacterized protein n=1 Tax=Acrodontium crateriforme TaxID=150365 RepID=A0AAQ3RBD7_9PEZI|nr:Hypothetical protein R9X50_00605700 [Acrodontium crateriforme]